MVASQALNAILLPLTVGSIIYLSNSRKIMGDLKAKATHNMIFGVILLFSLIMSAAGIYGLII
jgi:Mn2+/Fe2+ NRAMP family transporter